MGDREATLAAAVDDLRRLGSVEAVSSFYDTAPVGYVEQPRFLNAAVVLQTELAPEALLRAMLQIELAHGRDRANAVAKGPRTLDLDLLLYNDAVLHAPALTLPHAEMHLRRFVLGPLAAIAPAWVHPVLQRTVAQMLAELPAGDRILRAADAGAGDE